MAKEIIWSQKAQADRKSILSFWAKHNKSKRYSKKLNELFVNAAIQISHQPKLGKPTDFEDIRIKIIRNYFFTYRETKHTIEILTIWDCRQDPDKFKKILDQPENR